MNAIRFVRLFFCAALSAVALVNSAWSQPRVFPHGPVKLLVGFGPGGGTDITARLIADDLSKMWGQPVVIENKPGAKEGLHNSTEPHRIDAMIRTPI